MLTLGLFLVAAVAALRLTMNASGRKLREPLAGYTVLLSLIGWLIVMFGALLNLLSL
jgi:hypothetical protein